MPDTTATSASDLLTANEVAAILRITRRSLERFLSKGLFPQPIRLGVKVKGDRGRLRWQRITVENWLAKQQAAAQRS